MSDTCSDCTPPCAASCPCAACHWRTNDVLDLDTIEARAEDAMQWPREHDLELARVVADISALAAYVRRLEGERDVLHANAVGARALACVLDTERERLTALYVAAREYLATEGAFDRVTLAERMGRARHSCGAEAKYLEARVALKQVIAAMERALGGEP